VAEPAEAEVLPFTGIEDWLAPLALVLGLAGIAVMSFAGRAEEADID
jgi:hypothetical protein